ncbi:DNA topoisomerase family protein, partial [Vibrio parahaemolyticus V-223/04]
IRHRWWHFHS